MKKKFKLLSILSVSTFLFSISCSYPEPKVSEHKKIDGQAKQDTKPLLSDIKDSDELITTDNLHIYDLTFNLIKGQKRYIDFVKELPTYFSGISGNTNVIYFNDFEWDDDLQENDFIFNDLVLTGVSKSNRDIKVNIFIKTHIKEPNTLELKSGRTNNNSNLSDYFDLDKIAYQEKLWGLFDSDIRTNNRWDTWAFMSVPLNDTDEKKRQLVFKFTEEKEISLIKLWFWTGSPSGHDLPNSFTVEYSNDGVDYIPVKNQDKVSPSDFSPNQNLGQSESNVSEAKEINFSPVKTRFLKLKWDPSKRRDNNREVWNLIGLTELEFWGPEGQVRELFLSNDNALLEFNYDGKDYTNSFNEKNELTIIDNDLSVNSIEKIITKSSRGALSNKLKLMSQTTQKDKVISQVYKLFITSQKGQTQTYTITIKLGK
ncbi:hypothetical protein RRG49_01930 [Mycoplasmopsis felis]|uniref:hypothetical protein n=3 Tax=Mycoplasmopsis felis TaxID=33923 RepID=UPI002AFE908D|nr:hypothetical protein [Mycoplasmopsis felis]WQQ08947.1 hypothetical protein RRG41_02330 [Mycoplasmopsis felis]